MAGATHPLGIRPVDEDPPDRVLSAGNREWNLELTELTAPSVRRDLAQSREIGRQLEARLEGQHLDHLRGHTVLISYLPQDGALAGDPSDAVSEVVAMLDEDKGYVGEGLDLSQGLPNPWPEDARGFYGKTGPLTVTVQATGVENTITVVATAQAEIRRSEAIEKLRERIDAKDIEGNDILLITCGLPDARGYSCPLDTFLFEQLAEAAKSPRPFAPQHLTAVVLHLWNSVQWIVVCQAKDAAVPWADFDWATKTA
jgi:hypothetical protein